MNENDVVWVTGASSGIGEALAYAYAKKNCNLVLSARRESELLRVKENCNLADDKIMVLPLDITHYDEMDNKVTSVINRFGKISLLLNNAGISQRSLAIDTKFEVYKKLVDVDYLGTVALSLAVLPYFVKQQSGHFATVTSLMGKFGSPMRSGYCGAKHAIHGFFDVIRMEHENDNIDVSLICPGFIRTNISKNALVGDGSEQGTMDDTTDNGLSPEECAAKIVQGLDKRKFEILIGGKEIMAVYLKRLSPKLLHKVVKNAKVT